MLRDAVEKSFVVPEAQLSKDTMLQNNDQKPVVAEPVAETPRTGFGISMKRHNADAWVKKL